MMHSTLGNLYHQPGTNDVNFHLGPSPVTYHPRDFFMSYRELNTLHHSDNCETVWSHFDQNKRETYGRGQRQFHSYFETAYEEVHVSCFIYQHSSAKEKS